MFVVGFGGEGLFGVLNVGLAGVACVAAEDEVAAELVADPIFLGVGIHVGAGRNDQNKYSYAENAGGDHGLLLKYPS